MDDMIVKFIQEELYAQHLEWVFKRIQEFNMRLSPRSAPSGVRVNKFLGFYLTG